MTIQQEMKEKLAALGMPFHEIQCYGRQITIECISQDTCSKWSGIIGKFAKVKGILKSVVYTKENKKLQLIPSTMTVYRLYATIV